MRCDWRWFTRRIVMNFGSTNVQGFSQVYLIDCVLFRMRNAPTDTLDKISEDAPFFQSRELPDRNPTIKPVRN